jgi:hypothetical protein
MLISLFGKQHMHDMCRVQAGWMLLTPKIVAAAEDQFIGLDVMRAHCFTSVVHLSLGWQAHPLGASAAVSPVMWLNH